MSTIDNVHYHLGLQMAVSSNGIAMATAVNAQALKPVAEPGCFHRVGQGGASNQPGVAHKS